MWIEATTSPLGQRLHLQPLTILICGGFVAVAAHSVNVEDVDHSPEPNRPPPEHGTITTGPDPNGTASFVADLLLSLLGDFDSAIRTGSRALNSWETQFFESIAARSDGREPGLRFDKLREIQSSATALEESLVRLQQEELTSPRLPLSNFNARGGAARLRSSVAAAHGLRDSFRDGLALASSVLTTEQLQLARKADTRSQRLQGVITRLTAFLLVPAFVGTIFGANVWLPGATSVARFGWMAGIMVITALATYWLIGRLSEP